MIQPSLQFFDQEQIKPYLEQLKQILEVGKESLKSLDTTTVIGLSIALAVMLFSAKMLQRIFSGMGRSSGSDSAAIRKDAKKAKRDKDYTRAGELFEMAGDPDKAINMYRQAQAFLQLGQLYERQKNWTLSAAAYEGAREYDRAGYMYQRAGHYVKAAEILMAGNKTVMAAEMYEKAKNYREAAIIFEKAGYHQKAANCYERCQEPAKAAELLEKHYLQEKVRITNAFPTPEQKQQVNLIAQQSGRLYLKSGQPEKAAKIFALGELRGPAAEAYIAVKDFSKAANLYYDGKMYHKAIGLYKQTGNTKKAYTTTAEMYLEERNYLEAAKNYEKAEDYLQAGDLYEKSDQLKKAGEMLMKGGDFDRANELFQSCGEELMAAQALEKGNNRKEAAQIYLKAGAYEVAARLLEESGDHYEAGMVFHKLGRIEDTIAFLQKVDTQSEHYYTASLLLSQIFMDRGMLDAARERYKKLISKRELGPDTIEPYYNLALIYEKNREFENALLLFDKVLAENYNYKDIQKHIEHVKQALQQQKATSAGARPTKGRYKLIHKVGQGGMGVVYRAEDSVLNREVAYKVLPPSVKDNPKVLENFLQEARVAAAINHPNIVTIYDTGSEGVEPYIVMEYVDGITLKQLLEEKSPIAVEDLVAIAKQICHGLEYAHAKNVIHRDIKPANIMLSKENVVKIMDFGLAKILTDTSLEGSGVQGTPLYMSPEQIQGERVGHRTDLYSLGCTLYRMVAGRPPFMEGDVYYHHLHTPPVPPRSLNPKIPEALDRLILKCMAKNADQRYQWAKEILADLETIV